MGILGIKWGKKANKKRDEAKYWQEQAEYWRNLYRQEMLSNDAWRDAVYKAAVCGEISHEAQRTIYDLHTDANNSIYEKLFR